MIILCKYGMLLFCNLFQTSYIGKDIDLTVVLRDLNAIVTTSSIKPKCRNHSEIYKVMFY